MKRLWEIQFTNRKDTSGIFHLRLEEIPSREIAAQQLRDHLFGSSYLISDTPRDIEEKTVWQLAQMGVIIDGIVPFEYFNSEVEQFDLPTVLATLQRICDEANEKNGFVDTFTDNLIADLRSRSRVLGVEHMLLVNRDTGKYEVAS